MRFAITITAFQFLLFSCSAPTSNVVDSKEKSISDSSKRLIKNYFTDCKKLFTEANRMDSVLLKQMDLDKILANEAIKAFIDYAYYCQNDSLSPVFLIKTAQIAKAIDNIPQAKIVLDKCIADYPNFNNRAAALFLLAQLYDENTHMNNENEAKRLYQKIIDEYPKSDWALSAKGAIHFIGKSDDEIAKELLKRKK